MGGALHPIMLNAWFHGSVGFHNGVRASAGLNGILLIVSIILMKPRLPPSSKKVGSILNSFRTFLRDLPYVITIVGYVIILSLLHSASNFDVKNGSCSLRTLLSHLLFAIKRYKKWHQSHTSLLYGFFSLRRVAVCP